MSKLYFAKININDDRIFKVYKNKYIKNEILDRLFIAINNDVAYVKEEIYKYGDGKEEKHNVEYSFTGINKLQDDPTGVLVGGIIKRSHLYLKSYDENNEVVWRKEPFQELINFCLYPRKECIAFKKAIRFGHVEFCEAVEELINKCFDKGEYDSRCFRISLINKGINLDSIKKDLEKINNIDMLKIEIIPPNPDDDLLDEIENDAEKELEEMDEGNVTTKSVIFKSKSNIGINTRSKMISRELDKIEKIHSKLTTEEAVKKGYVTVEANSKYGPSYSTKNNNPIKYTIEDRIYGDVEFAELCKNKIIMLF